MVFKLEKVIPWGRFFDEYVMMFNLSTKDLEKKVLGCGDGPAAFNAELTRRGGSVISVDPVYQFSAKQIRERIDKSFEEVMEQSRLNADEFLWVHIRSIEELGRVRMEAMGEFLADYVEGKDEGRYVPASLPELPFKDKEFDLVLCSHLLFLYSEQLPFEFHLRSIRELCRVGREVRIFPLLEFGSVSSRYLDPLLSQLEKDGYQFSLETVSYEFQKGGNEMLKITEEGAGLSSAHLE